MRPFFGYHMPNYTFGGVADADLFAHVVELAQSAEKNGFDLITVMDHFYQIGVVGAEEEPMLEAYTVLGALATRSEGSTVWQIDPLKCTACGRCVQACPVPHVIKLRRQTEA